MPKDFKEAVIQLMQNPAMHKPLDELSFDELRHGYELARAVNDFLLDEEYTLLDYVQMARMQFFLGRVGYNLCEDNDLVVGYFKTALDYLEKGGIDLSIPKWAELISLRISE